MLDFLMISTRSTKRGIEVYPKFIIKNNSKDLMIRGGDFYAIWDESKGMWSTKEDDAIRMIDEELDKAGKEARARVDDEIKVLHLWDGDSGMIDKWHKYCQKQMRDSYHMLDTKVIFSNMETKKEDYASKKLNYPIENGDISAYEELISTLYSPEERRKIEWAIGSIVNGDSKKLQKFIVMYGAGGTGKSTIIKIIQALFDGYCTAFDAKSLGSSNSAFALESFKSNPLVAVDNEGNLSRIDDNTKLNALVSHDIMTVNEKFKSAYASSFNAFLFIATNYPVKITDAKSGVIRRLIDVSPTGNLVPLKRYLELEKQIKFELGAIAKHCLDVYNEDPHRYDNYIPQAMIGATNDFYNFMAESFLTFKDKNGTTLTSAWEMYKNYVEDARVMYPLSKMKVKEELKNYFEEYYERYTFDDGTRVRSYFKGFIENKFENDISEEVEEKEVKSTTWVELKEQPSIFDDIFKDCKAQYASVETEKPTKKWDNVKTTLKDLDTHKLHYVQVPENLIVIDLDLKDEKGEKSLERNLAAANAWPKTYAEVSKSGKALHLHYIYNGDPSKLSHVYDENIEIKVPSGNSSLRRKLIFCNALAIATISSGLPLKGEDKLVNFDAVKSEKSLRILIKKNLNKEIHPNTKPSIDFIYKILEDAYASDLQYDISDMRNDVLAFAASSSNQSAYCIKLVNKMHFKSKEETVNSEDPNADLIFFDCEVFPNLLLVNWKRKGKDKPVVRMINPTSEEIEDLLKFKLVGSNNRRYDNHILYARLMGWTNDMIFDLSQRLIVGKDKKAFFGEAYNLSYTDIYDFSSKKQSLKKWEIELGISHKELGLPWDEPVPENLWTRVAEYCDNDVIATEAVFDARQADFIAREILADVANMTVNDTTNSLTTKIIFGSEKHPQTQFEYRFMGDYDPNKKYVIPTDDTKYTLFDPDTGKPVFPGYKFEMTKEGPKSTYRGEEVGEGGYVYSEPGMYGNVALLDIASMHPSSAIAENFFGRYTVRFNDILQARIAIKHKDFESAKKMLGGVLAKYLKDEVMAKALAQALKIAINSVYGLTAAKFDNPFRDKRNVDNLIAKRGALFMVNLKHMVQERGFKVAHIKTDSIKIPDATPEIIKFVMDYGKLYGYTFEHEATYEKMCLINDAVYTAKDKADGHWTATGTQFQVPYVFKTLFSHEPIEFDDLCETKSVTSALYLKNVKQEVTNVETGQTDILEGDDLPEFIGRVGRFCPIKKGRGGKELLRVNKDKNGNVKYDAATGTKGYFWLESEVVKTLGKEDDIDRSYYDKQVDQAIDDISQYGDFEWFVSEDPYISPPLSSDGSPIYDSDEDLPF